MARRNKIGNIDGKEDTGRPDTKKKSKMQYKRHDKNAIDGKGSNSTVLDKPKDGDSNNNKLGWTIVAFLVALLAICLAMMATTATLEDISLIHQQQGEGSDTEHSSAVNSSPANEEENKSAMSAFPSQIRDILLSSGAWEEHPLLVTADHRARRARTNENKDNIIPTIEIPPNNADRYDPFWYKSLISQHDLDQVLHPPSPQPGVLPPYQLQHGVDYKLVTKIIDKNDGQTEWTGSLPNHLVQTLQQQVDAISTGGFSLIINKMQQRWTNITKLSRSIETSLMSNQVEHVSCNLYLTPTPVASGANDEFRSSSSSSQDPNKKQKNCGFESHWDWMDVIVIQISGSKLWSVANTFYPASLSTRDMKYKPTLDELSQYQRHRYDEFMLHPGDVLYIPRGFIHNASTIESSATLMSGVDHEGAVDGDDSLPAPGNAPSLHLTFGIEHGCQTTVEALLHHAIEYYYLNNHQHSSDDDTNIAISRNDCPNPRGGGQQAQRDILWKDLLHFVVSDIARRDAACSKNDESADSGFKSTTTHPFIRKLEESSIGGCLLRRSVPSASYIEQQLLGDGIAIGDGVNSGDEVIRELLKMAFDTILQTVASDAEGRETSSTAKSASTLDPVSQFIYKLEHGIGESIQSYCHPYISPLTTVPCYGSIAKYIQSYQLRHQLNQIYEFMFTNGEQQTQRQHFENVYNTWHNHVQQIRHAMWSEENELLRLVGQSVPSKLD